MPFRRSYDELGMHQFDAAIDADPDVPSPCSSHLRRCCILFAVFGGSTVVYLLLTVTI